jgi:hypothetical protein
VTNTIICSSLRTWMCTDEIEIWNPLFLLFCGPSVNNPKRRNWLQRYSSARSQPPARRTQQQRLEQKLSSKKISEKKNDEVSRTWLCLFWSVLSWNPFEIRVNKALRVCSSFLLPWYLWWSDERCHGALALYSYSVFVNWPAMTYKERELQKREEDALVDPAAHSFG